MNKQFLFVIVVSLFLLSNCSTTKNDYNEFEGKWGGVLKTPAKNVLVYIEFQRDSSNNKYVKVTGLLKKKNFPFFADSILTNGNKIFFSINKLNIDYNGKFLADSNKIKGIWRQGNFRTELVFYRENELYRIDRPQHPFPPYPYVADTVDFYNEKDSVRLVGTLTYPRNKNGKFPAILLLSGTGPHDRDETMYNHKPFLVMADFFTRHGFMVLRYDERGVGESSGDFYQSDIFNLKDDAVAAIGYLKTLDNVDTSKIGIIGFGEGGIIASLIAAERKEPGFIVLLSTPAITGAEVLIDQVQRIQMQNKISEDEIKKDLNFNKKLVKIISSEINLEKAELKIRKLYDKFIQEIPPEERRKPKYNKRIFYNQLRIMLTPWFKSYLTFDPVHIFSKISSFVLVLYGEKDLQLDPVKNYKLLTRELFKVNKGKVDGEILKDMNHLFQQSYTGLPEEYKKIKQTISVDVLNRILNWLDKKMKYNLQ